MSIVIIKNTSVLLFCFFLLYGNNVNAQQQRTFVVEFKTAPLALTYGKSLDSDPAKESHKKISQQHQAFTELLSRQFSKSSASYSIKNEYYYAFNGLSLSLNKQEALWVQSLPEVKSVTLQKFYEVNTDIGPEWIGADRIWEGLSLDMPANRGEGIVIGVIDTGINPTHPAFQAVSQPGTADEYLHTNPRGMTFGLCNAQNCNAKLIGIYDFTDEGTAGIDTTGHGSHVAGIALGNVYSTNYLGLDFTVSGVAPRANLISYKACFVSEDSPSGRCASDDLLAAIDQATANRVDVVNYSIGASVPCSPWGSLDNNGDWCGNFQVGLEAIAMLNARNAGVLFTVSAGNDGPGAATVGYPAIAPWVIAVANSTHSRRLQSEVVDFSGGESALQDLIGASATDGIGPLPIVHARDFGNALCGQGEPEFGTVCSGTGSGALTGSSNPFANNTFDGQIVVCDRGIYGRVEKGFNVMQAGAAGYILANTVAQQESIAADDHCLPATHIGNNAGDNLRQWLSSGDDHMATITGQTLVYDEALGDVLNASSSRGPAEIVFNTFAQTEATRRAVNYMKPNIAAPGTSIFSAAQTGDGLATLTGTSMAAPHVAGAVALIKSAHPSYTPAQIESSLLLTAEDSQMLKEDQFTRADFTDQGAGRTRVDRAVSNSIYFDISRQEYINANPQNGADITQLNVPSLVNNNCYPTCSFTRRVKLLNSYNVVDPVWRVTTEQSNGLGITVTPNSFDFTSSDEVVLNITIDTTANDVIGDWAQANIVFTVESSSHSDPMLDTISPAVSKLPVAVHVPAGNYPPFISQELSSRHGKFSIDLIDITPMTDATFVGLGVSLPESQTHPLITDSNNAAFSNNGTYEVSGSDFRLFEINEHKPVAIIEAISSSNFGADLYVGRDLNINNTPDEQEIICQDRGTAVIKRCIVKDLRPGLYWLMVNNNPVNGFSNVTTELAVFDINDIAKKTRFSIDSGIEKASGVYVKGPVNTGTNAELTIEYELPAQESPTGNYYAAIAVGADVNSVGKTAVIPIKLSVSDVITHKVYALNNNVVDFNYQVGDNLSNMYIDVGLGANEIVLNAPEVSYVARFYRTDFEFDPLNYVPDLSNSTPDFVVSSVLQETGDGMFDIQQVIIDVSGFEPSRWYIQIEPLTMIESGDLSGYFALDGQVNYDNDQMILPNQGLWFNPDRRGWGIDLSRTASSQAVTWYTYGDDGTKPVWMQAVGSLVEKNQWTGSMNHITWNGEAAKLQAFGDISLVYLSENSAIISISTPRITYTEKLVSLYSPNNKCPAFDDGQLLDVTGLWFLPEQLGFGSTILATEQTESSVFYFYDDLGLPVWVIGTRELSSVETLLDQIFGGFCPNCAVSETIAKNVGSIYNTYLTEQTGSMVTEINLLAPLSGTWQSTGVSQKLNQNFGCNIK